MLDLLDLYVTILLKTSGVYIITLAKIINVPNLSLVAIKDFSNLLEGRALSLNVKDADKDKLKSDPALAHVSK